LDGDRGQVRQQAVEIALKVLYERLTTLSE
jgi:hypothetical protein